MKNILTGTYIVGGVVGGILVVAFGFYAFFGFLTWIFNDPFNWVSPSPESRIVESPDILACRAKGGVAITNWTNRLIECQILK